MRQCVDHLILVGDEDRLLVIDEAAQFVLAEPARQIEGELRARTEELGSSVAELKMLSEVGQAVSSTLDLRTVLSTILNASLGVTWANAGAVFRYSRAERAFRLVEAVGWDEALAHSVRELHDWLLPGCSDSFWKAAASRASNPLRRSTTGASSDGTAAALSRKFRSDSFSVSMRCSPELCTFTIASSRSIERPESVMSTTR